MRRRLPTLSALVVAAAACLSTGARAADGPATDVRGLWVLRTSLTSPERVETMVRTAAAAGFNTLFVQVRGRGEALYRSAIEPRASELDGQPAAFDPLAATLDLAHRAGLRVHAWVCLDLVASAAALPRSSDHVVSRHPEWLMVPRDLAATLAGLDPRSPAYVGDLMRWTRAASDRVEGLYLSPIAADAQTYTASVIHELVSGYPIDGLHLDYARYPSEAFDYSPGAIAAFRASRLDAVPLAERQRLDARAAADPLIWTRMYPETWLAFRRERLTALVTRVAEDARATRPGLVVSAAVAPDPDEARDGRLQDWAAWAATGVLDVVCPMAYATGAASFEAQLTAARAGAGPTPIWAGVGAYLLPVAETIDRLRLARRLGAAGVLVYSYDSLAAGNASTGTYLADLRPALVESAKGAGRPPVPAHD